MAMKRGFLLFCSVFLIAAFAASPSFADNGRGRGYHNKGRNHEYRHDHRDNFRRTYYRFNGRQGYWHHGHHRGRNGWWFVSDNVWYAHTRPVHTKTVIVREPVVIRETVSAPGYAFAPQPPVYSPVGVANAGEYCREAQTTVIIGNQAQPAYGMACLQPDNSWKMVR